MILLVPVEPELRTRLRAEEKREQAPALQMELSIEPIIAEDSGESRKTSPTCQQHRNLEVLVLYRKRASAEQDDGSRCFGALSIKRLEGGRPRGGRGPYGN